MSRGTGNYQDTLKGTVNGITLADGKYTLRLTVGTQIEAADVVIDTTPPEISELAQKQDLSDLSGQAFSLVGTLTDAGPSGLAPESLEVTAMGSMLDGSPSLSESGTLKAKFNIGDITATDIEVSFDVNISDKAGNAAETTFYPLFIFADKKFTPGGRGYNGNTNRIRVKAHPSVGQWTVTVAGQKDLVSGTGDTWIIWDGCLIDRSVASIFQQVPLAPLPNGAYTLELTANTQKVSTSVEILSPSQYSLLSSDIRHENPDLSGTAIVGPNGMDYYEWVFIRQGGMRPLGSRIIISDIQFGKKIAKHARDFGLNPASEADRKFLEGYIYEIGLNPDYRAFGTFSGGDAGSRRNVIFFVKGKDVVVTDTNLNFVTILEGGITNANVKRGLGWK